MSRASGTDPSHIGWRTSADLLPILGTGWRPTNFRSPLGALGNFWELTSRSTRGEGLVSDGRSQAANRWATSCRVSELLEAIVLQESRLAARA